MLRICYMQYMAPGLISVPSETSETHNVLPRGRPLAELCLRGRGKNVSWWGLGVLHHRDVRTPGDEGGSWVTANCHSGSVRALHSPHFSAVLPAAGTAPTRGKAVHNV